MPEWSEALDPSIDAGLLSAYVDAALERYPEEPREWARAEVEAGRATVWQGPEWVTVTVGHDTPIARIHRSRLAAPSN
jgi:hypothetical protein